MSELKFKEGDQVIVVKPFGCSFTKIGTECTVIKLDTLYTDPPIVQVRKNDTREIGCNYEAAFELIKQKPSKVYTETDRRKAAKEVRVMRDKLAKLVDKAKEAGIKVEFVNKSIGMIDIVMEYQPSTPKKRTY